MEEMYRRLEEEISQGKSKEKKTIVLGDFNCRVGTLIHGNEDRVTKGGKYLLKMLEKTNTILANAENEKRRGLWTRIEGEKKSVIDYIIIDKEERACLKEMVIDEEKTYTPFHTVYENGAKVKKHTDHAVMTIGMNWACEASKPKMKKVILLY